MTLAKYVEVWKLLESFPFKIDANNGIDIHCSICKAIMIDPHRAYCGCQYCIKCISAYIENGNRYCPIGKQECNAEYLEIGKNVLKDFLASREIINYIVICPNQSCTVATELSNMTEHIRVCTVSVSSCRYESIGCTEGDCSSAKHEELLMNALNHLINDVDALKGTAMAKNIEINELKDGLKKSKEDIKSLEEDKISLEAVIAVMKEDSKETKEELNILRRNINIIEKENTMLTEELKQKYQANSKYTNKILMQNSEELNKFKSTLNTLMPIVGEDFFWKIENFPEKEGYYYSEPFCKEDYTLRIGAKHGLLYFTLYLHVIPSDKDNLAKWPMKYDVMMGVVNPDALKLYVTRSSSYHSYPYDKSVFDRQTDDNNEGIYIGSISIDEITALRELLLIDWIMISCTLTPSSSI